MLAQQNRLKQSDQIEKVFKAGRSAYRHFLFLKYLPNTLSVSRFAFSIGLKYSKKATTRNAAKRIMRSVVRQMLDDIKPGYDLVFYVKDVKEKELEYNIIKELVCDILCRAKLIKNNQKIQCQ